MTPLSSTSIFCNFVFGHVALSFLLAGYFFYEAPHMHENCRNNVKYNISYQSLRNLSLFLPCLWGTFSRQSLNPISGMEIM